MLHFLETLIYRHIQKWSPRTDLNCRPLPYQGSALPTELPGHFCEPIVTNYLSTILSLL